MLIAFKMYRLFTYISMQFVTKCQNKRRFDQEETSAGKFVMQFILRSKKERRILQSVSVKTPTNVPIDPIEYLSCKLNFVIKIYDFTAACSSSFRL